MTLQKVEQPLLRVAVLREHDHPFVVPLAIRPTNGVDPGEETRSTSIDPIRVRLGPFAEVFQDVALLVCERANDASGGGQTV